MRSESKEKFIRILLDNDIHHKQPLSISTNCFVLFQKLISFGDSILLPKSYHHWQISYLTLKIGLAHGRMWDLNGMEYYWRMKNP